MAKQIERGLGSGALKWGFVAAALVTVAAAFVTVVPMAEAAPRVEVEVSHSPGTMPRNDELLTYQAKVRNQASRNPAGETRFEWRRNGCLFWG